MRLTTSISEKSARIEILDTSPAASASAKEMRGTSQSKS